MGRKKQNHVIAFVLGILAAGFGWMIVKNFTEFFNPFSPMQQFWIGVLGFVGIVWFAKQMGITPNNPMRK